ncbi:MAG: nicotinamide-nucleotide amidohydrolase family protein, partial [Clostridiales bacterium]|nr:nicotinamide-nucleotide amidohydrolase family protein [Candidatus Equinaster intestinalis]
MKTVLFYDSSQSLTDEGLCRTIQKLSGIYCDEEPISLISCSDNLNFLKLFKKYSKKYQIFITNELYSFIAPSLSGLLQGYEIVDTFPFDSEEPEGLIAMRNFHTVTALPSGDKAIDAAICKAFCRKIFKNGLFYSYYTVTVSNPDLYEVNKKIRENIKTENQYISVVKNGESTDIYVFVASSNENDAAEQCKLCVNAICHLFGEDAFVSDINRIADSVVKALLKNGMKVATAESCTAGMISSEITSIPNSSSVFEIGIASYSNRIKNAALGVSKDTLEDYGAVSAETAIEMAKGIRNLSGADIGLSVTGVAGPDKSEGKKVGTVFIALADKLHKWVIKFEFGENNNREAVRRKATYEALELLRRYISCLPYTLQGGADVASPYCLLSEQPTSKDYTLYQNTSDTLNGADKGTFDYSMNSAGIVSDDDVFSNSENPSLITKIKNYFADKKYELSSRFSEVNRKIALRILSALITLAILVSSASVFAYFWNKSNNDKIISDLRGAWDITADHSAPDNSQYFGKLQNISPDILSWISVPDTEIENAVCKTSDNAYFGTHNLLGKLSLFGALHYDKNAKVTPDGADNSKNIIIYGKNSKDGSMFGSLKSYKALSYLKEHSQIKLYNSAYNDTYNIFSVMITSDSAEENGDNFNYLVSDFADGEQFSTWLNGIKERSLFQTVATITENAKFITLITDSDDFNGAKLVITAFSDPTLNIEENYHNTLKVNNAPRYPRIWYQIHGAKDPYEKFRETPVTPSSEPDVSETTTEVSSTTTEIAETSEETVTSQESDTSSKNTDSKATSSKATSSKSKRTDSSKPSTSKASSSSKPESKPESKQETSSKS